MGRVDDVAAALLARTGPVSAMKLQKLVFYSQAWHLANTGTALFPDRIEAWAQGPVVPALHKQHRKMFKISEWPLGRSEHLERAAIETVDWVVGKYRGFSAEALS